MREDVLVISGKERKDTELPWAWVYGPLREVRYWA